MFEKQRKYFGENGKVIDLIFSSASNVHSFLIKHKDKRIFFLSPGNIKIFGKEFNLVMNVVSVCYCHP